MSSALLKNLYLFKNLQPKDLDAISALGQTQSFMGGDTVFVRGESAKALYLIKHGSVKIQQSTKAGDNVDVATLASGSHFGEMPFVDNEPRSATAVAAEQTELVLIPYEKLAVYLKNNTDVAAVFYRDLSLYLAGRLRATTNDLSSAREKNFSLM